MCHRQTECRVRTAQSGVVTKTEKQLRNGAVSNLHLSSRTAASLRLCPNTDASSRPFSAATAEAPRLGRARCQAPAVLGPWEGTSVQSALVSDTNEHPL